MTQWTIRERVITRRKAQNPQQQLLAGIVADERLEFIAAMIRASANHRVPETMEAAGGE